MSTRLCAVTRDRSNLMRIVETQKRTIQLSRYLELSDWFSRLRVRYALPSRFV